MTTQLKLITPGITIPPTSPWEGIGADIKGFTGNQILVKGGLNWGAVKRPMFCHPDKSRKFIQVPRQYAVVRSDNNAVLGTVGENYTLQSNKELVDIGEAIVSEKAANFESAGLLRGGQQVWILMKVGGVMRVAGTDDTIDRFLLLHNSHDGSTLVRLCLTMKRIFCGNQLVNVEHAAEHRARARHTKNLMDKIAEIRDSLKLLPRFWAETQDKIDAMARIKLNTKALNIYLTDAVGVDPLADKGKTKANYDTLISAFETSPGNQVAGVKGSLWCAYNAVTYWLTHERTVRVTAGFQSEKEARLASLWGGTAEEANLRAWKAAQSYIF